MVVSIPTQMFYAAAVHAFILVLDNITSTCLPQVPTIQRKELMTTNVKDSRKQVVMSSGYGYLLTGVLDGWTSFGLFTNCVIEMTSLMTSSGPSEKLHGGTSQRSTFFNLGQAELLRVQCTVCLNSKRHLVIGPFQKSKFKPTVLPAGSLAPRQLAPG